MKNISNSSFSCGLTVKWSNRLLVVGLTAICAVLWASCQRNEYADMSGIVDEWEKVKPQPIDTLVFTHPCALYTAADFERVSKSLENGSAPAAVQQEFQALKDNRYTNGDYGVVSHATTEIVRGNPSGTMDGTENYATAMRDAASAFQFGLLWNLTKEEQYAKRGVFILNDWANKCQRVTAADPNFYLAAGCQGFTFALAGELLRGNTAWPEDEQVAFRLWMKKVFAEVNLDFLKRHNSTSCGAGHYWSNWDLVNMCSYFQIGILCEDKEMIEYICNYFLRNGNGNGNLDHLMTAEHNDPLGTGETLYQMQESGRDQGHATMALAVTAQLCQAAKALYQSNPLIKDLDFYGAKDNALLHGAEYIALTNLRQGSKNDNSDGAWLINIDQIPFTTVGPWCNGPDNHEASHPHTEFSSVGRGTARPNWEMIVAHYGKQLGLPCLYSETFAQKMRPECGSGDDRYGHNSGAFDQLGWSTLMLYTE